MSNAKNSAGSSGDRRKLTRAKLKNASKHDNKNTATAPITDAPKKASIFSKLDKRLGWVLRPWVAFIVLLLSVASVLGWPSIRDYYTPDISISAGAVLDQLRPFSAPFLIHNSGHYDLYDAECVFIPIKIVFMHGTEIGFTVGPGFEIRQNGNAFPRLRPTETKTVTFENFTFIAQPQSGVKVGSGTFIIRVRFHYWLSRHILTRDFTFAIFKDAAGNVQFFPEPTPELYNSLSPFADLSAR